MKLRTNHYALLTTAAAVCILLLPLLLRPYVVTGISMRPTYDEGTKVIAEKFSHHFHMSRGDILVIRNPHEKHVIEIKRVIGMPGELVELGEEGVTVTNTEGRSTKYEAGTEIGGTNNGTFRIQLGPEDYFVLGDNRSQSFDSRTFGAVQRPDIVGRVIMSW